ncbi:hypothetical protein ACOME3_009935 [Neoechinorhynchus agilis]
METIIDGQNQVRDVRFNQDCNCILVAYDSKLQIVSISEMLDAPDRIIHEAEIANVYVMERLFSSSLIAIVTSDDKLLLRMYQVDDWNEVCRTRLPEAILTVKLNRVRVVVGTFSTINIYSINNMQVLHTITNLQNHNASLIALSISSVDCNLAYQSPADPGSLQLFDSLIQKSKGLIKAHNSSLVHIAFDHSGLLVATASHKGTLIRVFNVPNCTQLCELRRGLRRVANINSMAFDKNGEYLAVCSDLRTVHVFKLPQSNPPTTTTAPHIHIQTHEIATSIGNNEDISNSATNTWTSTVVGLASSVANSMMSKARSTLVRSHGHSTSEKNPTIVFERSFISFKLPTAGSKPVCALTRLRNDLRIFIATKSGIIYTYGVHEYKRNKSNDNEVSVYLVSTFPLYDLDSGFMQTTKYSTVILSSPARKSNEGTEKSNSNDINANLNLDSDID